MRMHGDDKSHKRAFISCHGRGIRTRIDKFALTHKHTCKHTHTYNSHNRNHIQIKLSNRKRAYTFWLDRPDTPARCALHFAILNARANPLQESTEKSSHVEQSGVMCGRRHVGCVRMWAGTGLSKWHRIYDCTLRPLVNNTTTTTATLHDHYSIRLLNMQNALAPRHTHKHARAHSQYNDTYISLNYGCVAPHMPVCSCVHS